MSRGLVWKPLMWTSGKFFSVSSVSSVPWVCGNPPKQVDMQPQTPSSHRSCTEAPDGSWMAFTPFNHPLISPDFRPNILRPGAI